MLSLIVTTRDVNSKCFARFINSINKQNQNILNKIELIIVNQDKENIITQNIDVNHKIINSDKCSLSKARNIGLENVDVFSEIIGFPDDDCWYNNSVLEAIENQFKKESLDFLCCGVYDPISKKTYGRNRILNTRVKIDIKNALRLPISVGIFIKKDALDAKFKFDEKFGVGTKWGSGEESDLILNLLNHNKYGEYYSYDTVYHEVEDVKNDVNGNNRTYRYAKGIGALTVKSLKRRKQYYFFIIFINLIIRTIITLLIFAFNGTKRYLYINRLKGLISGFKEGVNYYYKHRDS